MTTTATNTARAARRTGRFTLAGLVARLVAADQRYREARKLKSMPDVRLKDMGLTRADADRAFLRGRF